MNRITCAAVVLALVLTGAACIQKKTRSVMYLQPDGSVTWTIFESDVHSDAKQATERESEEAEYHRQMLSNPTPLVALFQSLGSWQASRTVLKDTVPFEVHSSASFDRLDVLFERICAAASYYCVASVGDDGERTTLTVEMIGELDVKAPEQDALTDALDNLRIVLVEGRFVEASGFVLDDDVTAKLDDQTGKDDEPVTVRLVWERQ